MIYHNHNVKTNPISIISRELCVLDQSIKEEQATLWLSIPPFNDISSSSVLDQSKSKLLLLSASKESPGRFLSNNSPLSQIQIIIENYYIRFLFNMNVQFELVTIIVSFFHVTISISIDLLFFVPKLFSIFTGAVTYIKMIGFLSRTVQITMNFINSAF